MTRTPIRGLLILTSAKLRKKKTVSNFQENRKVYLKSFIPIKQKKKKEEEKQELLFWNHRFPSSNQAKRFINYFITSSLYRVSPLRMLSKGIPFEGAERVKYLYKSNVEIACIRV